MAQAKEEEEEAEAVAKVEDEAKAESEAESEIADYAKRNKKWRSPKSASFEFPFLFLLGSDPVEDNDQWHYQWKFSTYSTVFTRIQ